MLFENGMGDTLNVWDNVVERVYKETNATLITYNRAGYGKGVANESLNDTAFTVLNQVKLLEKALNKLGYNSDLLLVCHSYGGFYATLFAARNPQQVKGLIRLESSIATMYDDEFLKNFLEEKPEKKYGIGSYYEMINFPASVRYMRTINLPKTMQVIEAVAQLHEADEPIEMVIKWQDAHRAFVAEQPANRKLLIAENCRHQIMLDNPIWTANLIVKTYKEWVNTK